MVKTAAGILAGGKSSRMGKNKASLTWNGDTFLHTLIDACRDFPEIYVSVDDREKYRDLSCTLVEDEEKEYGPLEGIYQVLKQMDAPYAVMLATDMPMISREFLKALVSNITGEEDCLVLRREGRPQPLCSVYAKSILPVVEHMRRNREHKPGLLFQRVNTRYLDLEELGFGEAVIANVNTPEEYEQLCFHYGRKLQEFAPRVREKLTHGKVMVCYLDGLGYRMYKNAADNGSVPFISRNFSVLPVRTVEPPVTNPAMATTITAVCARDTLQKGQGSSGPHPVCRQEWGKYSIFRGGYQDFEDRTSAQASCCGKGKRLRLLDLPGCVQSGFGGKRIYFCPFS